MKSEQLIIDEYLSSRQNADASKAAVNSLRHMLMDAVAVDVKDDKAYMSVYERVMEYIASRYPLLSREVQRQIDKKKRRQARRSLEEQQVKLHI